MKENLSLAAVFKTLQMGHLEPILFLHNVDLPLIPLAPTVFPYDVGEESQTVPQEEPPLVYEQESTTGNVN